MPSLAPGLRFRLGHRRHHSLILTLSR
jgi:hypothetical protein